MIEFGASIKFVDSSGDVAAARACLESALKNQTNELLEERLAQLLFERGPLEDALAFLKSLCETYPEQAHHAQNLGVLLLRAGETEKAKVALERADELRPNHRTTATQLAEVHQILGNHEEAERWRRRGCPSVNA